MLGSVCNHPRNSRCQLIQPCSIQSGDIGAAAFYQIHRVFGAQAQHLRGGQPGVREHPALPGDVRKAFGQTVRLQRFHQTLAQAGDALALGGDFLFLELA